MMRSTASGATSARSSALRQASIDIVAVVSPGPAMCRSRMPVRVTIHSSEVSTICSRS